MSRKGSSGLSSLSSGGGNKLAVANNAIDKAVWKNNGGVIELKVPGVGKASIIESQVYKTPGSRPVTVYTGGARNNRGTSLSYLMGNPHSKQPQYASLSAAKSAVVNEMRQYVQWKYGKLTIL